MNIVCLMWILFNLNSKWLRLSVSIGSEQALYNEEKSKTYSTLLNKEYMEVDKSIINKIVLKEKLMKKKDQNIINKHLKRHIHV